VYLTKRPRRPVRTRDVDAGGVPARLYTPQGLPEGFYLTDDDMTWFGDRYCPEERRAEVKASPLLAGDLSGFPATYLVTAGFDPLRDEGEEFAKRLEKSGVRVALRRQEDLIHGFANTWSLGGRFQEALSEAAGALRTGLYARPR
jgi:acetyl esterase